MKTLVIGACTLDFTLDIDHLPVKGEDVNTKNVEIALGGMAFNVFNILNLFQCETILGSPIGQGTFADITRRLLKEKGCEPIGTIPGKDNGFCVCLIDNSKERSFISNHGNEYRFDTRLFENIDFNEIGYIYADGLEIEDPDGNNIVKFLEEKRKPILFAPGPRLQYLPKNLLERIYKLQPILHINETEASLICKKDSLYETANEINKITNNAVIITLGEHGCLLKENLKDPLIINTLSRKMVDANGAGDNHAGTILACLDKGFGLIDAVKIANIISGHVVMQKGSAMTYENFESALKEVKLISNKL